MPNLSLKYHLLRKTMRLIVFKKQMTGTADEILARFRGKGAHEHLRRNDALPAKEGLQTVYRACHENRARCGDSVLSAEY